MATKIEFNENPEWPDNAGTITTTADTPADVMAMVNHYRMFDAKTVEGATALNEVLQRGTLVKVDGTEKRPYFCESGALDYEWFEPYIIELEKVTGWRWPDGLALDLSGYFRTENQYTHILLKAEIDGGHFCYEMLVQAGEWNNKSAAVNAERYARDNAQKLLGKYRHVPEWIEEGFGRMRRNPAYRESAAPIYDPAPACHWLWNAMADYWWQNEATDAQRDIIARRVDNFNGAARPFVRESSGHMHDGHGFHYSDPNGTITWKTDGPKVSQISLQDFAKLRDAQ